MSEDLDQKLNQVFPGCVVRKDLLQRIKKGTNVPSFVLEFLLAKFCATDDPSEIQAGIEAVMETIHENYVRPDEANRAQSTVQQKGRHKFIDKVHVAFVEREKKHWAAMENFNSRRIAVPEKFYRDNDRLLEGGVWAEVMLGHNDSEEDDYAFYIEELRPIQLSRFDFDAFVDGRKKFTRDEWLEVMLRSVGLEPTGMSRRLQFHFLARLFPFVESNYNFIELGPRGTGKSYVFSEFSPYSTLISGGQTSTSVLFYNNQRRRVGIIGFWDVVAFDEVGGIRVRDRDTVQIMKDYMANGRFSRGTEVTANASLAFVGNIDDSIEALVAAPGMDLFKPLPPAFDLAVIHRFHTYLPGWEIPASNSSLLTNRYGFITDYVAEAFHHLAKHVNRYAYVKERLKLGPHVKGRDETAVNKTVAAFLKLLHPGCDPTVEELEEYAAYAIEGRRRVKEQLFKRKPDDEFAELNFSYFDQAGQEVPVFCAESASLFTGNTQSVTESLTGVVNTDNGTAEPKSNVPQEMHFTIRYGETGYGYERIFASYLPGASTVIVEDPYIRASHQIANFIRFCELVVRVGDAESIHLKTSSEEKMQELAISSRLDALKEDLTGHGVDFSYEFDPNMHDREVRLSNGWVIKIGRGFDIYQKVEKTDSGFGFYDFSLRPCLETKVDIFPGT
jgi:ATP-dependent Lon protease